MRKPKMDLTQYEEMNCLQDFLSQIKCLVDNSNMSASNCDKLYKKLEDTYRVWLDDEYAEFLASPETYDED
jgi:hypothetical protein